MADDNSGRPDPTTISSVLMVLNKKTNRLEPMPLDAETGALLIKQTTGTTVSLTSGVSGILPIANGGTNSSTALNNNRLMYSSAGSIIELGAMTDGQLVVGKTSNAPQVVTPSGDWTIDNAGVNTIGNLKITNAKIAAATIDLAAKVTGLLPVANGGTGISSGNSGGVPYFSGTGSIASSSALAANQLVLGGGAGATPATLGSLGTTTTVLHGNGAGAPTFGAVSLTADVSGDLPFANLTQIAGLSVLGVTGTLTGDVAGITGTADQVLRVSPAGASLIFGSIDLSKSAAVGTSILAAANGGTGLSTAAIGDIIYASATTPTWSKLAAVATGNALISGGTNTAPSYGKIGLTTHVSGTLPETSGGTNQSTYTTGDTLYASGSNTLSKLAIGTDRKFLSNSGGIPAWVHLLNYSNIGAANKTAGASDNGTIFAFDTTAATRTFTLPASSTVGAGYVVGAIKAASAANQITVAPNGIDTIRPSGAGVSQALNAQEAFILLMSDGAGEWKVLAVNDYMENKSTTNQSLATTGTYVTIASLTSPQLPPGDWDVSAGAYLIANGATVSGAFGLEITTSSGTGTPGDQAVGENALFNSFGSTLVNTGLCIAAYRVRQTAAGNLYLKGFATYSAGGPPQANGAKLSARRVA